MKNETTDWQPMGTLPHEGHVLLAIYAPTSWAYHVHSRHFDLRDPPRARELATRYARAWMPAPPEPPEEISMTEENQTTSKKQRKARVRLAIVEAEGAPAEIASALASLGWTWSEVQQMDREVDEHLENQNGSE